MQIRSLFFVVTGIFLAGSIQAQTWTLKQLEQEALFSNPAILGKRFSANSAQADVDAAKWQRYPTPGVTMSRDGQGNPNTLLTLQQPLWAGGRISAVIDSAQYRYKASESAVSESQQVIFSQIILSLIHI